MKDLANKNKQAMIDSLSVQTKQLSKLERSARICSSLPSIAEIIQLLAANPSEEERSFYLGQLVVMVNIISEQRKRSMLIRWFD